MRAWTITDAMCIASAEEIFWYAVARGLREDAIVPAMTEWEVHSAVATAVGNTAVETGVAQISTGTCAP